MQAKVQKWGNSLGVRIPRSFARQVGIDAGAAIDLSIEDGKLIIVPVEMPTLRLEDLVRQVTPENTHREIETGPPRGKEAW